MGGACSAPADPAKVQPDQHNSSLPRLLQTQFIPPIKHVSNDNPWLPLLTPHQLVEINSAFRKFDRDGDGHIEPKELQRVMGDIGCPVDYEEVQKLISGVDVDGNGKIEFDEFIGIMATRMMKATGDDELEQALSLFDDGSGFVHVDSVRDVLCTQGSQRLVQGEVTQLLEPLADAQGRVSLANFRLADCWRLPPSISTPRKRAVSRGAEEGGGSRTDGGAADAAGSSTG